MYDDITYDDRIGNFDFEWDEHRYAEYHMQVSPERMWEPVYPDYTEDDDFPALQYDDEIYL